jgi:hypothetical protein
MFEDIPAVIDGLTTVAQCEAMIHMLDYRVQHIRILQRRAHDRLEKLQVNETIAARLQKASMGLQGAESPRAQGIGV